MKIVGIHNVLLITKAGDDGSHAVYPLASNVFRIPPFGKEEASGSCCTYKSPSNLSIALPGPTGLKNASCFSAVEPVNG